MNSISGNMEKLKIDKKQLLIFLIVIVIYIIFEYFTREFFTQLSVSYMENHKITSSQCKYYERLSFFETSNGRLLIYTFVFNVNNIFNTFLIISITETSVFLNSIFKLIYSSPRPFWISNKIVPCLCSESYGNPSTGAIVLTIIFLTLPKILEKKYDERDQSNIIRKRSFFNASFSLLCYTLLSFSFYGKIHQKIHSINQLFFGFFIGLCVYYFIFHILCIDFSKLDNVKFLINKKIYFLTVLICISIFLMTNLIHSLKEFEFEEIWLKRILNYCKYDANSIFDNESYMSSSSILNVISAYSAIIIEYYYYFQTKPENFYYYNIESGISAGNFSEYNWNYMESDDKRTDFLNLCVRIFSMYFLCKIILWGLKSINPYKGEFFFELIFNNVIPSLMYGITLIFISKQIFKKLRLTNENIHNVQGIN